jgi:transcription elongation factor GreA-like protein
LNRYRCRASPESPTPKDKAVFESFVNSISTIPVKDRADAIVVLKKLAFFDSIHDFWHERGAKPKKKLTDEDQDAPIDIVDDSRIKEVHSNLMESIKSYLD